MAPTVLAVLPMALAVLPTELTALAASNAHRDRSPRPTFPEMSGAR